MSPSATIEMHVNNGEAHFHDRTTNLKVAVPVAEWFKAAKDKFLGLDQTQSNTWTYWDRVNNTRLSVHMWLDMDVVRTQIHITRLRPDDVTSGFIRFIDRSVLGKA